MDAWSPTEEPTDEWSDSTRDTVSQRRRLGFSFEDDSPDRACESASLRRWPYPTNLEKLARGAF